MSASFVRALPNAKSAPGRSIVFALHDDEVLLRIENGQPRLIFDDEMVWPGVDTEPIYLGVLDGTPVAAQDLDTDAIRPTEFVTVPLRELTGTLGHDVYSLAGYARQMLHWRKTSRFCPACGAETEGRQDDWGRSCPSCGHIGYPRVSPAVLILVHDGDRILLAHKPGWNDRYSILAGFVDPAESLEDCVRREVREEVGVEVADLRYDGSQPWPHPHQLMIGFTAGYAGGNMRVDGVELDKAGWFTPQNMPNLPPPISLSRQMIDRWLAKKPTPA
jgi:NAD+ diphosphatase